MSVSEYSSFFSSSSSSELVKVTMRSCRTQQPSCLRLTVGGDSTGSLPLAEVIAAPTKWGDALLAWTIWRTTASSPGLDNLAHNSIVPLGTETLLV